MFGVLLKNMVCVYAFAFVRIVMYALLDRYVYKYISICMYVCMYVCARARACVCVCVCVCYDGLRPIKRVTTLPIKRNIYPHLPKIIDYQQLFFVG